MKERYRRKVIYQGELKRVSLKKGYLRYEVGGIESLQKDRPGPGKTVLLKNESLKRIFTFDIRDCGGKNREEKKEPSSVNGHSVISRKKIGARIKALANEGRAKERRKWGNYGVSGIQDGVVCLPKEALW